jgi:hypothetical protein
MALVAALGGVAVSSPTGAAQPKVVAVAPDFAVQPVHYDGRAYWWDRRRAHDEARIAAAARREALRIQRERAARRSAYRAHRHQYSQYRGW